MAGYNFDTIEALSSSYTVLSKFRKGIYRNVMGNQCTALGFWLHLKISKELFLGSYPITPHLTFST